MVNKKPIKLEDYQTKNFQSGTLFESNMKIERNYDMQIDTYLKEIKADMREREERSERRHKEQQELLLSRVDKKLDENLGDIKEDIKELKSSNWKWGIGIIVSIIIAVIGALPQLLQLYLNSLN